MPAANADPMPVFKTPSERDTMLSCRSPAGWLGRALRGVLRHLRAMTPARGNRIRSHDLPDDLRRDLGLADPPPEDRLDAFFATPRGCPRRRNR